MKFIEFKELNEKVLFEKLKNGLEVYILRKKDFNSYEARFFTDFGGIDIEFIPEGEKEMIKMPSGIAHFLEHKLFEQKGRESVFDFYKKTGTNVNAFTNYNKTCYYINGTKNFKENLQFLLNFVQEPYLTDKNVEKEKGIIIEEAKMRLDNPNILFAERILSNLFTKIPYDNTVVGSIKDIKSITKKDLLKCYNTFYHPSNMKLFVVSPYDEKEVLKIVKENQDSKKFKKQNEIVRKKYKETEKVKVSHDILKADVKLKRFCYTIKMKLDTFNSNKIEVHDSIIIYLTLLIGSLSEFNLNLKKDSLINGDISYSIDFTEEGEDDFVCIRFYATTEEEEKIISLLEKELTKKDVSKEDFEDFKKIIVASTFFSLNTIEGTMAFLCGIYNFFGKLNSDYIKIEKNLSYEKFMEIINKMNLKNKSITILEPKENES